MFSKQKSNFLFLDFLKFYLLRNKRKQNLQRNGLVDMLVFLFIVYLQIFLFYFVNLFTFMVVIPFSLVRDPRSFHVIFLV